MIYHNKTWVIRYAIVITISMAFRNIRWVLQRNRSASCHLDRVNSLFIYQKCSHVPWATGPASLVAMTLARFPTIIVSTEMFFLTTAPAWTVHQSRIVICLVRTVKKLRRRKWKHKSDPKYSLVMCSWKRLNNFSGRNAISTWLFRTNICYILIKNLYKLTSTPKL